MRQATLLVRSSSQARSAAASAGACWPSAMRERARLSHISASAGASSAARSNSRTAASQRLARCASTPAWRWLSARRALADSKDVEFFMIGPV
jgi:hypothetical protein